MTPDTYDHIRERISARLSDTRLKQVVTEEIRMLLAERPPGLPPEQFCSTVACLILKEIASQTDSKPERRELDLPDGATPELSSLDYDIIVSGLLAAAQYDLVGNNLQMVRALGHAIAERDSGTSDHSTKVTIFALRLGEEANLSRKQLQALIKGAFLHDIGKIGIPDALLLKRTGLTDDEYHKMKSHPSRGAEMITGIIWLEDALDVVLHHHERWDGSGYPKQLKGDAIPMNARVFAIADVFDAMTTERPYKPEYSFDDTMDHLRQGSGSHFDPELLGKFDGIAGGVYRTMQSLSATELESQIVEILREYFGLDPKGRYIGPWLKATIGDSK